jgi:CubicO group peptidase (beta-lactamase class C family)
MVGIAQQEGYLNINNAVSQYLGAGWTSLPPAKESLITVRHLLTMTSGLEFNVPDLNCTLPSCLLYRADAGTQWYYHNAPYLLLKDVVEAATGKNFNVYLNQTLGFAGINPVFLNTPTSPHVAFSLPRVMLRFGLLVQNRGIWENDTVFNSSYFTDWTQPSQTLNPGYGYLWWLNGSSTHRLPGFNISFPGPIVPNAPADAYMAAGLNEQRLYLVPSKGWAIVRMGEATGAPTAAISSFDDQLWAHLNWALCNPVGTNDQNHQKATLYPNPANEFLYVMGNLPKKATYTIKNTQGMVVKHGWADTKIAIADLATGLYFLEIHAQGGVFLMEKFAVQN